MRFYTMQHRFYCGIDLHARSMHVCILDNVGAVVFDRNLPCRPDSLLPARCHAFAAHSDVDVSFIPCGAANACLASSHELGERIHLQRDFHVSRVEPSTRPRPLGRPLVQTTPRLGQLPANYNAGPPEFEE